MKINAIARKYQKPVLAAIVTAGNYCPIGDIADSLNISVNVAWAAMSQLRKAGLIENFHNVGVNGEWVVRALNTGSPAAVISQPAKTGSPAATILAILAGLAVSAIAFYFGLTH